jgi:hypothetical protein
MIARIDAPRRPDWERRLNAWLRAYAATPHSYGRHDCMVGLAAGVIRAVTGADPARGHRGKYGSKRAAALYLKRVFGVETPADLLDQLLPARPVAKARRGDLVLTDDGVPAVVLAGKAAFIGMNALRAGLITVPRRHWVRAWAVG